MFTNSSIVTMSSDYRILAHICDNGIVFQIHEVYYNANGNPNRYSHNPIVVGSENISGMCLVLNMISDAKKRPILWSGDKFPDVCKIKYVCKICGRNNFDKPIPHKCISGFRKRKLNWNTLYV